MDAIDPWEAPGIQLVGAKLREDNKLEPTHPVGTENHWGTFLQVTGCAVTFTLSA